MSQAAIIEGIIKEAGKEDLYKPWIRIAKNKRQWINNKEFVKVRANSKQIYCQVRGTVDEDTEKIEMSEHYRQLLGWEQKPTGSIRLEIIRFNQLLGIIMTFFYHPDDLARFSGIGLGATSLTVALIGLLISILSFIRPETLWFVIGFSSIISILIGFLIIMAKSFLMPLTK